MSKPKPKQRSKPKQKPTDIPAITFSNRARQYQKAASRLFESVEKMPKVGNQYHLSNPINFLYSHTVELALKAFLRSHGKTVSTGRDGHDIVTLHGRCQVLGLRLPGDDPHGLENVVKLLATENHVHGFRYFNPQSGTAIPDLPWTRDVVNSLIAVVRARVEREVPPGGAVKVQLIVGKPTKQTKD